jgi:hypothetical protein
MRKEKKKNKSFAEPDGKNSRNIREKSSEKKQKKNTVEGELFGESTPRFLLLGFVVWGTWKSLSVKYFYDWIGALICIVGVLVMLWAPVPDKLAYG